MDASQIDMAILSLPPTSHSGRIGPENRRSAREHNEYAASICKRYPDRFGFFASLPLLDDVEGQAAVLRLDWHFSDDIVFFFIAIGALSEIEYAFDQLHADGIALASQYNTSQFCPRTNGYSYGIR